MLQLLPRPLQWCNEGPWRPLPCGWGPCPCWESTSPEEERLRAIALDEYEAAHEAICAQATAVINVKALIPVILNQATNTYTKWRGMFLTVLGKYALTRHVLEDEAFLAWSAWHRRTMSFWRGSTARLQRLVAVPHATAMPHLQGDAPD